MRHLLLPATDVALALLCVGLAWGTLWARDSSRMIMLFIAFGGIVGLIWVRLNAPDVALAEVAIGAALTSGMLLRSYGLLAGGGSSREADTPAGRWIALIVAVCVFIPFTLALIALDWPANRHLASAMVFERLGDSGVTNPVTAVLLNFRAYDTLLEVAVLLVAIIGVWVLNARASAMPRVQGDPVYETMLRLFVPVLCTLAGYLLWLGSFAPGGAFQGGAMLAAALILLLLSASPRVPGRVDSVALRLGLTAGLLLFILVAAGVTTLGGELLQYPAGTAKTTILAIEGMLTVSIGATLLMLFLGGRPHQNSGTPK